MDGARTNLVLGVLNSILPDELQLDELKQLLGIGNALEDRAQVEQRLLVVYVSEGGESVPLAGWVALGLEEGGD